MLFLIDLFLCGFCLQPHLILFVFDNHYLKTYIIQFTIKHLLSLFSLLIYLFEPIIQQRQLSLILLRLNFDLMP